MSKYRIFTDSTCDLSAKTLDALSVYCLPLTASFEGGEDCGTEGDMRFYERLKGGERVCTSGVNPQTFLAAFSAALSFGEDVLYLGFSSALSSTYAASEMAAGDLSRSFPDRKIVTVDTRCASIGLGLLVMLAAQFRDDGSTLEQTAQVIREAAPAICHWFTVDDLMHLRRGGRICTSAALVGGLLGVKPILHMDDGGNLAAVGKVRGRKNAIESLCDRFGEDCTDRRKPVGICQAGCPDDAAYLAQRLKARFGVTVQTVEPIGTVIGAHCGSGTLGLFFFGKKR